MPSRYGAIFETPGTFYTLSLQRQNGDYAEHEFKIAVLTAPDGLNTTLEGLEEARSVMLRP